MSSARQPSGVDVVLRRRVRVGAAVHLLGHPRHDELPVHGNNAADGVRRLRRGTPDAAKTGRRALAACRRERPGVCEALAGVGEHREERLLRGVRRRSDARRPGAHHRRDAAVDHLVRRVHRDGHVASRDVRRAASRRIGAASCARAPSGRRDWSCSGDAERRSPPDTLGCRGWFAARAARRVSERTSDRGEPGRSAVRRRHGRPTP